MTDSDGKMFEHDAFGLRGRWLMISGVNSSFEPSASPEQQFARALEGTRQVFRLGVAKTKPRLAVEPSELAKKWGIGLDVAQRMVRRTTQRGVQLVLHPSLTRRFRTYDRQLRYRRLRHDLYTDTLELAVKSRRGNKYAQVFSATNQWAKAYLMERKAHAHHGLSLLFQREGVPPRIVCV